MYYFYKQGTIPPCPQLPNGVEIKKGTPNPFVPGMSEMQIGKKKYLYYQIMTLLNRGLHRVFEEYDVIVDNKVVSKAVLISKVPVYKFLPKKGIHVCYCETIPEARGNGYYPMLLSYIQNDKTQKNLYMIVEEHNLSSIKGIEKTGFVRYALGDKLNFGCFVETSRL